LTGHAKANRQKPSGIAAKEMVLRVHLLPALGNKRLDGIKTEHVQRLKSSLEVKSPKTVNNVLSALSIVLKKAVEWDVIDRLPCTVTLLPVPKGSTDFYDFDEFERLVEAAQLLDPRTHLIILLGGEAGLRCGEMVALEWKDVDLVNRQLTVSRSDWNGHVPTPKGGLPRHVPMTMRLAAALGEHRHLRSTRVLCQDDLKPFTRQIVQTRASRAAKRAGVLHGSPKSSGGCVHILRHTSCSHLAMRGAPARAIQELAGHKDLAMTQRYMHLSPAALDAAIRLLEEPSGHDKTGPHRRSFGDSLETEGGVEKRSIKPGTKLAVRQGFAPIPDEPSASRDVTEDLPNRQRPNGVREIWR
jgi:integrase